jgi:glycosyltransferase involved in cell wall biosynthesis
VHAELNGINRELFRPRSAEPEGAPVLGMAGHLTPWKGHLRFVRLLAELRAEVPDLLGRIAGAPIYDTGAHATFGDRVQESISRHQLDDYCRVDPLAPEEMPGWLAGLTVLAHCPDRPEPFGRVLAEALAVGVPVVSASEGGPSEILGDAGILLSLGDDRGLHDAVLGLLRDRSARTQLAEAGLVRAARHFDERGYATRVAGRILALA